MWSFILGIICVVFFSFRVSFRCSFYLNCRNWKPVVIFTCSFEALWSNNLSVKILRLKALHLAPLQRCGGVGEALRKGCSMLRMRIKNVTYTTVSSVWNKEIIYLAQGRDYLEKYGGKQFQEKKKFRVNNLSLFSLCVCVLICLFIWLCLVSYTWRKSQCSRNKTSTIPKLRKYVISLLFVSIDFLIGLGNLIRHDRNLCWLSFDIKDDWMQSRRPVQHFFGLLIPIFKLLSRSSR